MFPSQNLSKFARRLSQRSLRRPNTPDTLDPNASASIHALSTVEEEEDWSDWEDAAVGDGSRDEAIDASGRAVAPAGPAGHGDSPGRRSDRSSRHSRKRSSAPADLKKLLLDFPLPPKSIPTPHSASTSRHAELTPIVDDHSIFYDNDPFRSSTLGPEPPEDHAPTIKALSTITSSGKDSSFYTARSRASTGSDRSDVRTAGRSSTSSPPLPKTPTLPPTPPPPAKSRPVTPRPYSPNNDIEPARSTSHRRTASILSHSTTISKATASLRRVGSTIHSGIKSSVHELKKTPFKHKRSASVDVLRAAASPAPNFQLPDIVPQGFHVELPAFESPQQSLYVSPQTPLRRMQSFYGSLEDLPSPDTPAPATLRARYLSAPSLISPRPENAPFIPSAAFLAKPSFAHHPPRPTRAIPPEPPELSPVPQWEPPPFKRYERVDPLTLGKSETTDSRMLPSAVSSPPHSPSWLSRNVVGFEHAFRMPKSESIAVATPDRDSTFNFSNSSHESMVSSDSFYSNLVEASDVGSPSTISPNTPALPEQATLSLPRHSVRRQYSYDASSTTTSEPFSIRGYLDIQDARSTRTKLTINTHLVTPPAAERHRRPHAPAPAVPQMSRSISSNSRTPISARPQVARQRTRSRSNSVTRATITHFRRSIVEHRKQSRTTLGETRPSITNSVRAENMPSSRPRNAPLSYTPSTTAAPSAASTTTYARSTTTASLPPPSLGPVDPADIAPSSSASSSTLARAPRPRPRPRPRPQEAHTRLRYDS